ncbi:hypothetical protein V8C44DRAFT_332843 [Trichoderma aethiopicum]
MGRPLFVAPVETDLPHKEATKRDVLSPGRSAIRRSAHAGFRDRRNAIRRAAVRIVDIPPPSAPQSPQRRVGTTSWETEVGYAEEPEPSSGPGREALRDVTTRPERRRDRYLEQQMSSIFGGTWHSFSPSSQRDDEARAERDLRWNEDPRPHLLNEETRPRRARVVAPDDLRRHRHPHEHRSHQLGTPPLRPARDRLERSRTESPSNDDISQPNAFQVYRRWRRNQAQAREFRALMRHSYANTRPDSNSFDGLGDRDRSLSPEGWDTLLSTLTPDPQPPSATSSFASAAASQSAGSSNVPPPAPGVHDEAADGACESGHEMSDDDDDDDNNNNNDDDYANWESRAAALTRDVGVVRFYSLNGVPAPGVPFPRPESLRRIGSLAPRNPSLSLTHGRTPGSGSEDESRPGRLQPNQEGSAGNGRGAHTGDEEWSGMQRIVRSLAAREDIPDEWWAEAGLNRTLPQDGSHW